MRDLMDDYGKSFWGDFNPDAADAYYIDGFGTFGGILRGVAGLEYQAHAVKLTPHLPPEISSYTQLRPYYWGKKELSLKVEGQGSTVNEIFVNGKPVQGEGNSVTLDYASLPEKAEILFCRS
jgi:cellobiose phosphorylase